MRPSNPSAEKENLAMLRVFREQLDLDGLSDEDRQAMAENWATIYDPTPTTPLRGGPMVGMAFPLFDPNALDIEPRLIPCTLALRAFAHAIESGLPGAEHEAEQFLRECGYEAAAIQEILQKMIAHAPMPAPEDLN